MSPKKIKTWNLKGYIISALRKIFRWSPHRKEALERAKAKNGLYKCAITKKALPIDQVTVDHKDPVVDPKKGFVGFDEFIARLFCAPSNLQVISREVHKKKTAEERKERNKKKKEDKAK